jgi:alpha-N-arabinofuranosidase
MKSMVKVFSVESLCVALILTTATSYTWAADFHVSVKGNDADSGTLSKPLKTISAAAQLAQPGDMITVHEGTYRERITPPRGGTSDAKRIVYQAAKGEHVTVKGSEIMKGWNRDLHDCWKVVVPNTFFGDYNPFSDPIRGDWFYPKDRKHHTGAVYLDGHWLIEAAKLEEVMMPVGNGVPWVSQMDSEPAGVPARLWYAEVDEENTTLWAQFGDNNPNEHLVEINVRRAAFYPDKPFVNYITVRGFTLEHAATQWAPPTAEQIGLIGTHWSKGWIIEDNTVRYSVCTGITLGKYGDQWDNTSADTAVGYVKTVERALENGWNKETVGGHVVRNNTISNCEQAGLVGSLGAIFSTITGNTIHDIHVRRLFTGAEMAGIKLHAPIDTEISDNHVYRTVRGIWLDWMTQGTRVSRNLLYDNGPAEDLFVEVNHGPFLVDNNIFLSKKSISDWSEGGAYVHNLFAGNIWLRPELSRDTPYHPAHTTKVAGLVNTKGGDNRFYNNIFAGGTGLKVYDNATLEMHVGSNVYLHGAASYKGEADSLTLPEFDPDMALVEQADGVYLNLTLPDGVAKLKNRVVTTELLGKAKIPDLPYTNADGTPVKIDSDYFGTDRNTAKPFPGPFVRSLNGKTRLKVWPRK